MEDLRFEPPFLGVFAKNGILTQYMGAALPGHPNRWGGTFGLYRKNFPYRNAQYFFKITQP
jgi:hypothetical protein